jgi:hypothetical protein
MIIPYAGESPERKQIPSRKRRNQSHREL